MNFNKRKNLFFFFFLIFVSKELFFFDEELLVVFSFFSIFTLLFFSLKRLISLELESRILAIHEQFKILLQLQISLFSVRLVVYEQRVYNLIDQSMNTLGGYLFIYRNHFQVYINSLTKWFQRSILFQFDKESTWGGINHQLLILTSLSLNQEGTLTLSPMAAVLQQFLGKVQVVSTDKLSFSSRL